MKYDILSLFPEYFIGPFDVSILKRARQKELIDIELVNIRDFANDKHQTVDDRPYGGGPGMVLKPGPLTEAIRSKRTKESRVIMLSPQGKVLNAAKCRELAKESHLILVCGHYEAVDERVIESEIDEEISIGDYVLTSGAPAAIVLIDAVSRFIPHVIGHEEAASQDSFEGDKTFDAPHYTRPEEFEGKRVPEVLTNGNHAEIEKWRRAKGLLKTKRVRPDLIRANEDNLGV
ncbi:MAG: tRNA (guanosine(37)-N1)-methyltransferase TrmD [Rhabdochlamydiaceae bacterium]|nr:tRNA (guanosine(37)-N1)-methyltransferase TrmD [Candidatus Amphrikana amoebophyrae]